MAKILRINTKTRQTAVEDSGRYQLLGGRALTSSIISNEVPADAPAISHHNKLAIAAGNLTGSAAANSGRISVGGKSPLTGTIKESNSGGVFAQKLAKLGYRALVLEDKPDDNAGWSVLVVDKDGLRFEPADDLAGLGTYDAMDKLHKKYGEKAGGMVIGPAGETLRMAASIQFSDPEGRPARAAGRGGLGAVMGSKKIKAVVLDDAGCPQVKPDNAEAFKAANKRWVEILQGHAVTSQGLPAYGTAILINVINESGALPTKNFRYGQFEFAQDISGETMAETIEKRGGKTKEGCHPGCIIQCSQQYVDEKGEYVTSGFEYETIWALGANTTIKDLDILAQLDRACDDRGLDTIDTGCALAVAMDGGLIPWGDGAAALDLVRKVGTGDAWGRVLGNGTKYIGQALGVERIPVVKGQSLPAYDPRSVKGVGVTYATSTQGADHTAGYAVCQNVLKCGGDVDPHGKEGQLEISKNLQVATAAVDSLGLCLFVAFAVLDTEDGVQTICDLVSSLEGREFTPDDLVNLGVQTLKNEIAFNRDAGFTEAHDQLPAFFREEPLPPHDTLWDFTSRELQGAKVE
jgi:aldehyde:ferredoxin oxidoreductase